MNKMASPSGEYDLISRLEAVLGSQYSGQWNLLIGDDAAVRSCGDQQLIATADISVENVHFSLEYMNLEEIGYRAMVSNLSDCASMGAIADAALVQITFPSDTPDPGGCLEQIYSGFARACSRWKFPVAGGDLSCGSHWVIGITLLGRVPQGCRVLRRKGVQNQDHLWVTGQCGESAAGLEVLRKWGRNSIPDRYRRLSAAHIEPLPRIESGLGLAGCSEVHAMMDLSDGLSKDCRTLGYENRMGVVIQADPTLVSQEMVQLSNELGVSWLDWFLYGGEDYHLVFAASPLFDPLLIDDRIGFRKIGYFTDIYDRVMLERNGKLTEVSRGGWDHLEKQC